MLYRPALVALAGLGVWLFVRLFAPVDAVATLQWNTLFFIGLCYSLFFLGCLFAQRNRNVGKLVRAAQRTPWNLQLRTRLFWTSVSIGFSGMMLRYVDRVVIREIDYAVATDELRQALESSNFSVTSAIASVIMPFCFIPLILLLTSRWQKGHLLKYLVAFMLFVLPMVESLAQSSRSIMLLTIMLALFAICLLRFRGELMHRKLIVPAGLIVVATLISSAVIFTGRLNDYGRALEDSVVDSVYATAFQPNDNAKEGISSDNELQKKYYETVLPNSMYYMSGIYELNLAINRPDEQKFGYGSQIFYPYFRVIGIITGNEIVIQDAIVYRTGVFTSFFGPIWYDFQLFSVIFMFIFGYYTQKMVPEICSRNMSILPLYLFFLVVIFYMPVFNFLLSGFGFFIVHGFILFIFLSKYRSNKKIRRAIVRRNT